jgi:large subunit ribosomal protein L7Ae
VKILIFIIHLINVATSGINISYQ